MRVLPVYDSEFWSVSEFGMATMRVWEACDESFGGRYDLEFWSVSEIGRATMRIWKAY